MGEQIEHGLINSKGMAEFNNADQMINCSNESL